MGGGLGTRPRGGGGSRTGAPSLPPDCPLRGASGPGGPPPWPGRGPAGPALSPASTLCPSWSPCCCPRRRPLLGKPAGGPAGSSTGGSRPWRSRPGPARPLPRALAWGRQGRQRGEGPARGPRAPEPGPGRPGSPTRPGASPAAPGARPPCPTPRLARPAKTRPVTTPPTASGTGSPVAATGKPVSGAVGAARPGLGCAPCSLRPPRPVPGPPCPRSPGCAASRPPGR